MHYGAATRSSGRRTTIASRSITRTATRGPSCQRDTGNRGIGESGNREIGKSRLPDGRFLDYRLPDFPITRFPDSLLIEVEVPGRLGDRLVLRLAKRFLEAARQRVAAILLFGERFLEQRLAARGLLGQDALRVVQLGAIRIGRLAVADDALQVAVDHELGRTARAVDLEFGCELGHAIYPPAPAAVRRARPSPASRAV